MITPDLASIQQVFQRRVLGAAAGIESHVLSSVGANAAERVAVYVDAYRSRLLESLGKDFPGVRRLLGDAEFERLGREYIDAHPSDTRSIRWFGRHLPALLRRTRRDRPVVIEMADFEWQQGEVFDAPEAGRTTEAEFAAVPADAWPLMRLTFHPSMRRLDLAWNVVEYWQAINDKGPAPVPTLSAGHVPWLLWHRSLEVHWRSLVVDEAAALDLALEGRSFGGVCERLADFPTGETAPRAASLLKRWVADELICGVEWN